MNKKTLTNKKITSKNTSLFIPMEKVINKIFFIRKKKVMLDKDLAELYGVETKYLNKAVKRNIKRFPPDFMFQLKKEEAILLVSQNVIPNLRSQFVTSSLRFQIGTLKNGRGQHLKYSPYVFTEQGVAMLSSVLNSERAILVNIQIIRTFTKLRELISTNIKLRKKIELMEKKYDHKFSQVFDVLKQLLMQEVRPKKKVGF